MFGKQSFENSLTDRGNRAYELCAPKEVITHTHGWLLGNILFTIGKHFKHFKVPLS